MASSTLGKVASMPVTLLGALTGLAREQQTEAARVRLSGRVSWYKDVLRLRDSTIPRVWTSVLGFTIFSSVVAVAQMSYGKSWRLSNSVVPLLSVVVGLLLVFRNGAAFARWEAGRVTFGSQMSSVRNLARDAWVHIGAATFDDQRVDSKGNARPYTHANWTDADVEEKKQALRLMVAFVVACRHHVRGEYGTDWEDLSSLLPADVKQPISVMDELRMTESPSGSPSDERTRLIESADAVMVHNEFMKPTMPLPSVIIHRLALYFIKVRAEGFLDLAGPAGANALNAHLDALTNEVSALERLGSMPIPTVYGVHLKQVVTLFLLVLPFTLVTELSWKMIPFVTTYAFVLLGIEAIACEIEEPFGDDSSDLPLALLCAELHSEIEHLMANLPQSPAA